MFYLGKLLLFLVSPSNMLAVMLGSGWICMLMGKPVAGKILLALASTVLLIAAFTPMGKMFYVPLENRFSKPVPMPEQVDGIIVLGGSVQARLSRLNGEISLNQSVERLIGFADLARQYPDARLVFTGGSGSVRFQQYKEADAAREFFEWLEMDVDRIEFESQSRTTWENARNSKEMVHPEKNEQWLLVTSAAHMPRAVGIFRAQDWNVIPYPVDHNTSGKVEMDDIPKLSQGLWWLDAAAYEWLALAGYHFSGRTRNLFPKQ